MPRKTTSIDKLRTDLLRVKQDREKMLTEVHRLVNQLDLAADVPTGLIDQRRWNVNPGYLPEQPLPAFPPPLQVTDDVGYVFFGGLKVVVPTFPPLQVDDQTTNVILPADSIW